MISLILHLLFPLFVVACVYFSALHNSHGTSDIRIVDYDQFTKRFQDDTQSLIRDGVIRVYRKGSNVYFILSRVFGALAFIAYVAQAIILFN